MGRAVVAYVVTARGNLFDVIGILIHPLFDEKKGAFDLVFVKDIEQGICLFVAPCRVKGQGADLFIGVHIVDRDFARLADGRDHLIRCCSRHYQRDRADQHAGEQYRQFAAG